MSSTIKLLTTSIYKYILYKCLDVTFAYTRELGWYNYSHTHRQQQCKVKPTYYKYNHLKCIARAFNIIICLWSLAKRAVASVWKSDMRLEINIPDSTDHRTQISWLAFGKIVNVRIKTFLRKSISVFLECSTYFLECITNAPYYLSTYICVLAAFTRKLCCAFRWSMGFCVYRPDRARSYWAHAPPKCISAWRSYAVYSVYSLCCAVLKHLIGNCITSELWAVTTSRNYIWIVLLWSNLIWPIFNDGLVHGLKRCLNEKLMHCLCL